ncbi:phage integrase N-terminal SAM-like domain-containing protein [Vibrio mytili]
MKSQFLLSLKEHKLTRHYSNKTIESYLFWIKRYIVFLYRDFYKRSCLLI